MIDTHCHLDFKNYNGRREQLIAEAQAAGVHTIINIGVDPESSKRSVELAQTHDSVYATVGIHPHDAKKLGVSTLEELRRLAQRPKVVAIGEIGLDFYRTLSPRDVQRRAFRKQLELAIELRLPVVIHTRESLRETIDTVKEYAGRLAGGVFHCFPGDSGDASEVFPLGFVISVGGVITFKGSRMSQVAAEVPLEKLILETDSPYLTPVPYRGKENQPAYVRFVYKKLAELRRAPVAEVEKTVDRTAQKVFHLVETFGD
ncbi:MAG: TatD family hydrolase [Candidatus Zixiibacteriota bacterium]